MKKRFELAAHWIELEKVEDDWWKYTDSCGVVADVTESEAAEQAALAGEVGFALVQEGSPANV